MCWEQYLIGLSKKMAHSFDVADALSFSWETVEIVYIKTTRAKRLCKNGATYDCQIW